VKEDALTDFAPLSVRASPTVYYLLFLIGFIQN
jgi:hypothetical protein